MYHIAVNGILFLQITGVLFLKGGTYQTALQHSSLYETNTFFYSFDFVSDNSVFDLMFMGEDIPFDAGMF